MKPVLTITAFGLLIALSGCATDDPNRRAKTGAAIGAVTGAVLGHQMDGDKGRFIGAAVGAMAGGAVGNYMDKQQRELEEQLAEEQRRNEIELQRLKDNVLKVNLSSEVSFDVDKADIKPGFYGSLNKLADVVAKYDSTVVHVVGHTDSSGSDRYNQRLSERRALSVRDYLASRGVAASRTRTEGRGESEPRATNATVEGRAQNRRVEIYLKPVVEGRESEAYAPPGG